MSTASVPHKTREDAAVHAIGAAFGALQPAVPGLHRAQAFEPVLPPAPEFDREQAHEPGLDHPTPYPEPPAPGIEPEPPADLLGRMGPARGRARHRCPAITIPSTYSPDEDRAHDDSRSRGAGPYS